MTSPSLVTRLMWCRLCPLPRSSRLHRETGLSCLVVSASFHLATHVCSCCLACTGVDPSLVEQAPAGDNYIVRVTCYDTVVFSVLVFLPSSHPSAITLTGNGFKRAEIHAKLFQWKKTTCIHHLPVCLSLPLN